VTAPEHSNRSRSCSPHDDGPPGGSAELAVPCHVAGGAADDGALDSGAENSALGIGRRTAIAA